jgi:hypothetical protein
LTTSEELRAQVRTDIDRNGDIVAKRDDARAAQERPIRLVSTREKKEIANSPTESILGRAHRLVQGRRGAEYGHPLDNHGATAAMFAAYVQRKYDIVVPLDADDVCWFNIFQKGSRDANEPREDNLVDTAGYAFNLELIRAERARRAK